MLLLAIIACNIENHHLLVLDLLRCPCPPHSIHFKKLPQPPSLPDGIQNCPEQSPFEIVEEDGHTKENPSYISSDFSSVELMQGFKVETS